MEVGGRYFKKMVTRCCPAGKWEFEDLRSSGGMSCDHFGFSGFWDFLDWKTLKPATPKMIREAKKQEKLEFKRVEYFHNVIRHKSKEEKLEYFDKERKEKIETTRNELINYLDSIDDVPDGFSFKRSSEQKITKQEVLEQFDKKHSKEKEDKLREIWREGEFNGTDTEKWKNLSKELNELRNMK